MLNISWPELITILVIGLLILGPKELITIIKKLKSIAASAKQQLNLFTSQINDTYDAGDLKKQAQEINQELKTIIDLNGNEQQAYNIDEILENPDFNKKENADG